MAVTTKILKPTPSAYNYQLLIKHLLTTPLIYSPNQEIVYRDVKRYTYTELGKRVARLANALTRIGVKPGDTVAVMDWDSHRYLECFFAVPMMGAVLHTINIRLTPEQLIYTINHAEDDIILVNKEFLPMLEAVKGRFEKVRKIVLLSDEGPSAETALTIDAEYETLLAESADSYDFPDFDENSIATTFYTTGTTGLPKGVFFSHRQLVLHTYAILATYCAYKSQANLNSADVYMPITPMFHVHAWGVPYMVTLMGNKQVYPGRYEPELLLKLYAKERVTFSHCVPTILHMLLTSPAAKSVDLRGWKVIIGGSALPRGLAKTALEMGINVYAGYGMSETCPVLTVANLKPKMLGWDMEKQLNVRVRTGLPVPGAYVQVVDPDGNPQPHDGVSTGEVVVRTPWLTQGYLKDAEKSEQLWHNGWLHTGDIGYFDKEGYLQVTDRLKDVIKTGGEWVSSLELEDIISQHPAVSEAAVIGVPDPKWGESPMALVVPKPAFVDKITEDELKDFYKRFVDEGVIPKYGIPKRILIVDAIAKTSVGKLNKKELRKQFGHG
ncbi:fatty acid--CoA ligase [Desulfatitalea tepidiphila]|uniref:fatty acid--CoA ligase n=1 Tax=Desulfatitalea tepidiphila TaxID=1185843 RepID=UPI0006B49333|nr:fatty acid--CoA ligase [Desulfatitalea tepidiphila]